MEAATAPSLVKSGFTNRSGGHVGVTVLDNGREKHLPVKPDAEIFLSAEEQILTANAPANDKDNPFQNGSLVLTTPSKKLANRRPIGDPTALGEDADVEAPAVDPEEAEAARQAAEEEAAEKAKAEAERTAKAQQQGERGAQPRRARPPAKSEGEGAHEEAPPPDETSTAPQSAQAEGQRAAGEEVGTPEAESSG